MQRLYLNKDGIPWYVNDSVDDARAANVVKAQDPVPPQSTGAGAMH
jgi:hypothetical protein